MSTTLFVHIALISYFPILICTVYSFAIREDIKTRKTFEFERCPNLGGGFTLARIFLQLFPIGYFPLKEVYFDQRFILAALKSVFGIIGQSRDEFWCLCKKKRHFLGIFPKTFVNPPSHFWHAKFILRC